MSRFQNNNDNTLQGSQTGRINKDNNRKRHLSQSHQSKLPQNKDWVSTASVTCPLKKQNQKCFNIHYDAGNQSILRP